MPELPEVETTRRGITPHLTGRIIRFATVRDGRLRWPVRADLPAWLQGRRIEAIERRAKYLLLRLSGPATLVVHLGMSGSLRLVTPEIPPRKHDHIDLVLDSGQALRYHDPRRFGAFLDHEGHGEHPRLAGLGPEPLEDKFDGDHLAAAARGRRLAIKKLIMTNTVVVGVGNIYANEALFLARIHPATPAGNCTPDQLQRLAGTIRQVLADAIVQGGTTLRDFVREDGQPGYFAQSLRVYDRHGEPCRTCASPIERQVIDQRASFFCPSCQPRS
ncbi:MAG: bifunctional DNA-formamidopyrimidine glycosylase/DNA-(apurinic or apyrimidinic site) lyase [Halothiobacillaceae bacterium]